jgi:hypothetical protein
MTDIQNAPDQAGGESPAVTEDQAWGNERGIFGKAADMVRDAFGRFAGKQEPEPEAQPVQAAPEPVAAQSEPTPAAVQAPPTVAAQPEPARVEPPPAPPSLLDDPEGYQRYQEQQAQATRLDMSVMLVKSLPGYEDYDAVEAVFVEAAKANPSLTAKMLAAPNPAVFAYQEGKRHAAMREWGDDPSQFLNRAEQKLFSDPVTVADKIAANPALLAAVLAKAGASVPQAPNVTKFPPSLATARSTGGNAGQPPHTPPEEGDVWGGRAKRKS